MNSNGSVPAPASTETVPIWLPAGHVSELICASLHCSTAGTSPTSPRGSTVVTSLRYCCPSPGRSRLNVKADLAPATDGTTFVACAGANGSGEEQAPPLPSESTTNLLRRVTVSVPLNGVSRSSVLASAHASGLASGARGPLLNVRIALLNGCSGFSAKVAVTCPVDSFASALPLRRTEIPYRFDSASRYIVYGLPVIGPDSGPPR